MTFQEWFYNAPHRTQYTKDHPTYFVAEEAWSAAHEACAKVCEALRDEDGYEAWNTECAEAIRARGEK